MREMPSGLGGRKVATMANGKWRMANGRPQNADQKNRSPVRVLRSVLFSLLIAILLVGVALAVEGDIVFKRAGGEGGVPPAVFPHWFHRIRFKCYACHPSIFQMKAGADNITMDAIGEGKFCGTCHNGKIAWEIGFNTCPKCHAGK